jgi:hypothetical protein
MKVTGLTTEAIRDRVRALGDWFHNINLRGVQTAPEHFLGDYPSGARSPARSPPTSPARVSSTSAATRASTPSR